MRCWLIRSLCFLLLFCPIRVHLIASVPGRHTGSDKNKWGHLKLRKVNCAISCQKSFLFDGQAFFVNSELFLSPRRWNALIIELYSGTQNRIKCHIYYSCYSNMEDAMTRVYNLGPWLVSSPALVRLAGTRQAGCVQNGWKV